MAQSTGHPLENSPERCEVLSRMYKIDLEHQYTIPVEYELDVTTYTPSGLENINGFKVTKYKCVCGKESDS